MSGAAEPAWLLFVYGTLRVGSAPPELRGALARLRRLGPARLAGRLYDLGPYPGAVPEEGADTTVRGEVLELPRDPALLRVLDAYEGYRAERPERSLFVRVARRVVLDTGEECRCWVYAYARDPGDAPLLVDGDYLARKPGPP